VFTEHRWVSEGLAWISLPSATDLVSLVKYRTLRSALSVELIRCNDPNRFVSDFAPSPERTLELDLAVR
jgi:hypothetical protein